MFTLSSVDDGSPVLLRSQSAASGYISSAYRDRRPGTAPETPRLQALVAAEHAFLRRKILPRTGLRDQYAANQGHTSAATPTTKSIRYVGPGAPMLSRPITRRQASSWDNVNYGDSSHPINGYPRRLLTPSTSSGTLVFPPPSITTSAPSTPRCKVRKQRSFFGASEGRTPFFRVGRPRDLRDRSTRGQFSSEDSDITQTSSAPYLNDRLPLLTGCFSSPVDNSARDLAIARDREESDITQASATSHLHDRLLLLTNCFSSPNNTSAQDLAIARAREEYLSQLELHRQRVQESKAGTSNNFSRPLAKTVRTRSTTVYGDGISSAPVFDFQASKKRMNFNFDTIRKGFKSRFFKKPQSLNTMPPQQIQSSTQHYGQAGNEHNADSQDHDGNPTNLHPVETANNYMPPTRPSSTALESLSLRENAPNLPTVQNTVQAGTNVQRAFQTASTHRIPSAESAQTWENEVEGSVTTAPSVRYRVSSLISLNFDPTSLDFDPPSLNFDPPRVSFTRNGGKETTNRAPQRRGLFNGAIDRSQMRLHADPNTPRQHAPIREAEGRRIGSDFLGVASPSSTYSRDTDGNTWGEQSESAPTAYTRRAIFGHMERSVASRRAALERMDSSVAHPNAGMRGRFRATDVDRSRHNTQEDSDSGTSRPQINRSGAENVNGSETPKQEPGPSTRPAGLTNGDLTNRSVSAMNASHPAQQTGRLRGGALPPSALRLPSPVRPVPTPWWMPPNAEQE